jgi:hypothetical protein
MAAVTIGIADIQRIIPTIPVALSTILLAKSLSLRARSKAVLKLVQKAAA